MGVVVPLRTRHAIRLLDPSDEGRVFHGHLLCTLEQLPLSQTVGLRAVLSVPGRPPNPGVP